MNITYCTDRFPSPDEVIDLYRSAGLRRPLEDRARMAKMYQQSNLIVSAWDGELLVGVARSVTDFCYCCYLSDLAVREEYKHQGIGKQLVALTKETVGPESMLLLLSAPAAMPYYPKIGMDKVENGFIVPRAL
jgi:predicted N-acetyltransferase YhbS